MGLFDFLKKAVEPEDVMRTTTIRYAADSEPVVPEMTQTTEPYASGSFRLTVQDTFTITGRGTVITGCVEVGQVSVGDVVQLRRADGSGRQVRVTGVEVFRKMLDTATEGMNVGLMLADIEKSEIGRGDVLEA